MMPRWSVPLIDLPHTYFEVTLFQSTLFYRNITLGVIPYDEDDKIGQDLRPYGIETRNTGYFPFFREHLPPQGPGCVIGCGLTADGDLFISLPGQIIPLVSYPDNFSLLYPTFSSGRGTQYEINFEAKNPTGDPFRLGSIRKPKFEVIGNPIAQVDYSTAVPNIFSCLPPDILRKLRDLLDDRTKCFLSVSTEMHKTWRSIYHWIDFHSLRRELIGAYRAYRRDKSAGQVESVPVDFELKEDGTFHGETTTALESITFQGLWQLSMCPRQNKSFVHFHSDATKFSSKQVYTESLLPTKSVLHL